MRASEVIGGLSVVGVIALVGFAIADDASSDTLTTPPAPTILAPIGSSPETVPIPSTSSTATSTQPQSTDVVEAPAVTDPVESGPTTTGAPATTGATTVPPSLSPEERSVVRVQVVNAGGVGGAAAFATGIIRSAGFEPVSPRDGVADVDQNTILFAPGQDIAAAIVNESIEADPEFVREANSDDPNWSEFGSELDVLVMIGPASP